MAEPGVEERGKSLDFQATQLALSSSSTNKRISHLKFVDERIRELDPARTSTLLQILFTTYALYQDRSSRRAVQKCLASILTSQNLDSTRIAPFVSAVGEECLKPGIASTNAFVLVEWCGLLTQHLVGSPLWDRYGTQIVLGHAAALEKCVHSDTRSGISHSAITITRRGLRKLISASGDRPGSMLGDVVRTLCAKGARPTSKNAVYLGVAAGVATRIGAAKPVVAGLKDQYFAFYTREVIGSRTAVPAHVASGLSDFFADFVTLEEFEKEIASSLEKGLLRAPEIVLRDIMGPLISSLPESYDLTNVLNTRLLRPILSNVKSSHPDMRVGAVTALRAVVAKSNDARILEQVVDEIADPMKSGKLATPEQKIAHAQMLEAIPLSKEVAEKIVTSLAAVSAKEGNEAALGVETEALARAVRATLQHGNELKGPTLEAITKGLSEKKYASRRLWLLRMGDVLYSYRECAEPTSAMAKFAESILPKIADAYNEALANPSTASQNGVVVGGLVACALSDSLGEKLGSASVEAIVGKLAVEKQCLVTEPKLPFLLNPRVYMKLAADEVVWLNRALFVVSSFLTESTPQSVKIAWAEACIYTLCCPDIPSTVRQHAARELSLTYARSPALVSSSLVAASWQLLGLGDGPSTEAAAWFSRGGLDNLHVVLKTMCLAPKEAALLGWQRDPRLVSSLLRSLLVMARPRLIPRASWIDLCLRTETDPGALARECASELIAEIVQITDTQPNVSIRTAAYEAAAELAFVAPDVLTPKIVELVVVDLRVEELQDITPLDAVIMKATGDTPVVDVLANKKGQDPTPSKNTKDYDILKWEQETRAALEKKKGQERKLTADESARVNARLKKEAAIRKSVRALQGRLQRGFGIVKALASGPPTDPILWLGPAIDSTIRAANAGSCLITAASGPKSLIACADTMSNRLGTMRPIIGAATLRAMGITTMPKEYKQEALDELVTRVLYRLRFAGEQRPFDAVSFIYMLPLLLHVLRIGGVGKDPEERDTQVVLAVEVISFHTNVCVQEVVPRGELLSVLISAMQQYAQHYKAIRDCFADICRCIAPNMNAAEISVLTKGATVPDVAVRTTVLQSISAEVDMSELDSSDEIWLASHDDVEENRELGREIWEESGFKVTKDLAFRMLPHLKSKDAQLRKSAARSLSDASNSLPLALDRLIGQLTETYVELAKPRVQLLDEFGMPKKMDLSDPWEGRHGVATALKELAPQFKKTELDLVIRFLIYQGPLRDKNAGVRGEMLSAALRAIEIHGKAVVDELMATFEKTIDDAADRHSEAADLVDEAVIIMYGALAGHLGPGDAKIPVVIERLLATLNTPSESVQYAISECLPPLVRACEDKSPKYFEQIIHTLLTSKVYASQRGAAYGLAGLVVGRGICVLKDCRIVSTIRDAAENKKDIGHREAAFLAIELLSTIAGRIFEPYIIELVPVLLAGFSDGNANVRDACLAAAKSCFAHLSSFGVKKILPTLLNGLDDQAWRSKKGACDLLGAMAYLDPHQLAQSLPDIIPPLTGVLSDTHKEVRTAANKSLKRFGEVIKNPEIKGLVDVLLKALSDPTKYTEDALDALIKVQFVHYLDAPSLALVIRILQRGLVDRSNTKKKASQVIGSLAHLTERKDIVSHLPVLVSGLKIAAVDAVPTTRATASRALGSLVEKLGEDALPDLIPSLMQTLQTETSASDLLGSAQALSEVLAGLGTSRLEETLPSILQNVESSKPTVREGFMSLFIFLPVCFGNSFANYLGRIIPPILAGLADDVDSIRDTALRAGRLLVKNFSAKAVDLLLPELERGLADSSHRIRLSSVELVGDLLFNLTGISGKQEEDEEDPDVERGVKDAGAALRESLGIEKRDRILSCLYICRCDTAAGVRAAAIGVWKALVRTPRLLKEITPTMTQLIVRRLGSSDMEHKVIASNALGELIRKAGDGVLSGLLPTLEEGLRTSTDTDAKQGICLALKELVASASAEALEDHEKVLISVVRTALTDSDADVREAAAEAFDSLQQVLGKRAIDQVLPYLLNLLRSDDDADNALQALLTLLTETTRSNVILPNLIPTLTKPPISAFNAKALASLSRVAGAAMNRRLPNIINSLMDNLVGSSADEALSKDLDDSLDAVILSIDGADGLNTVMNVLLKLLKHDDHRRRAATADHLAKFFAVAEVDYSRYGPDIVRTLLALFDDRDGDVVRAAWNGLNEFTKKLRKDEMGQLVIPTRQSLANVGFPGANLPGFELPKGINAVLPIFLQGLMNGSLDQRIAAAAGISDMVDRASEASLKPFVTQITGPLIRVVSERPTDVKAAILLTIIALLEKMPTALRPFMPQLQRTFAKALAEPSSEVLRTRAAKALGVLIKHTPRVDPLITELVAGSKTADPGVRTAMLKALYEVISKAGTNMGEPSRAAILGLIDMDVVDERDDDMTVTNAKLLGVLIKNVPADVALGLLRNRVVTPHFTHSSVLALNAVLVESPDALLGSILVGELPGLLSQGMGNKNTFIADNCILACGKFLLGPAPKTYDGTKIFFEALANAIQPGNPTDSRRLGLAIVRALSRTNNGLVRPHVLLLAPPVFAGVRDVVIPVKLAAEAAFVALFNVADEDSKVFDKFMAAHGDELAPTVKRSMGDYFKRVGLRLGQQMRERREAEGGVVGALGLSSDERDDEREIWGVGREAAADGGMFT